mgnify:CR=1 FL=1
MRPALRPVEIIRVPNGQGALVTVLRDPEAIAPHAVEVRAPLDAALGLFDGRRETAEIAKVLRWRVPTSWRTFGRPPARAARTTAIRESWLGSSRRSASVAPARRR